MFARISSVLFFVFAFFTLLAAATNPTVTVTVTAPATTQTITVNQCNTGNIQCCDSTVTAGSGVGSLLLGLLGIVISDLEVLLGLNCSPLSILEILGGATCSASPVCCENNSVNSLISIGCIPIIL